MRRFVKIFSVLLFVEIFTTALVGVLFYNHFINLTEFLNKLSVLFIFLFMLTIAASYIITKREEDIYFSIEALINDVRQGKKLEIPETDDIVLHRIYVAIKRIYSIMEKQQQLIEAERQQLKSLIDSIKEGILLIDEEGNIELINPTARSFLKIAANRGNIFDLSGEIRIINALKELLGSKESLTVEVEDRIYLIKSQRLQNKVLFLITDVSEQEKYQKMKAKFFEEASHELKTPITSIMGFSETLLDNDKIDEGTRRRFLKYIYESASHLTELIEDILTLSRLERREVKTEGLCDLNELKEQLMASFGNRCSQKNLDMFVSCEPEKVKIPCAHIKSIIWNLLDNAIKFTQSGYVKLTCRMDKGNFVIIVEDTGIGIDRKDQERIFERFYTSQVSKDSRLSGTGLGLAIVKHIVNLYNGSIHLSSERGKGSKFTISLPLPKN